MISRLLYQCTLLVLKLVSEEYIETVELYWLELYNNIIFLKL